MNLNSRETRRLNIKSFINRRCLWRCCHYCLNCLLLLGWRASVCTCDHLFFSVTLCSEVCLLCTRLSTHFSAVHSVVIACAGDICLLFKLLLKFRNCDIARAGAPLLVIQIKISKKTSPQRWRFSFALKRNEKKLNINKSSMKTVIHATRE